MAVSAKDVAELRKQTGCGMMDCKNALVEANGNFEEATKILREKGMATAAKIDFKKKTHWQARAVFPCGPFCAKRHST